MCVGLLRKMFINCRAACHKVANFIAPPNKNKDDIGSSEEEQIIQRSRDRIVGKKNRGKSTNKSAKEGAGSVVIDSDVSSMSGISESESAVKDRRTVNAKEARYPKKGITSTKEWNRAVNEQMSDDHNSLVSLSLSKCEEKDVKRENTDKKRLRNQNNSRDDRLARDTSNVSQVSVLRNKIPFKKNENYRSSSVTESSSNISLLPSDNEYGETKPTINFKNKSDYSDLIENYENSGEQRQVIDKMKKFLKKCEGKKKSKK